MDEKMALRVASADAEERAGMHGTLSFAADPEQKARCLARLQVGQLGPENQPSECAAGGKHRFTEELGIPAVLAVMIDMLCWLRQTDSEITVHEQAMALIAAIPVAANLTAVPPSYAFWLLHDKQWGIAQYCPASQFQALLPQIKALHAQELAGNLVDEGQWTVLEQRARASVEAGAASNDDQQYLESVLEFLAAPLRRVDAEQMGKLLGGAAYFSGESSKARYWDVSDEQQLDALYEAFRAKHAQGARPAAGQTAELAIWTNREQLLDAAWEQAMRQQQPVLWARWEAWGVRQASLYAAFNSAAVETLLSQFAQAPLRNVFAPSPQLH